MKHKQEVWKVCHDLQLKANNAEAQDAAIMFSDFIFTVINVFFIPLLSLSK